MRRRVGGGEENKDNIFIIIILGGRLTLYYAGLIYRFLLPIIILFLHKIFILF